MVMVVVVVYVKNPDHLLGKISTSSSFRNHGAERPKVLKTLHLVGAVSSFHPCSGIILLGRVPRRNLFQG